jgi:mitogen-activated protein kinase organizer 1
MSGVEAAQGAFRDILKVRLSGHKGGVNVARFTKDGSYCMTGSDDRVVKLWNPHKEDPSSSSGNALQIKEYNGIHGYSILDIAISDDKSKFASGGDDRAIFFQDVLSGRVIRRIQGHSHRVNALAMNSAGNVLISASYDQTVCCWDLRSQERDPIQMMKDAKDSVTSLAVTDYLIISGSVDGNVRSYDIRKGLLDTDNLADPVVCVRVSTDFRCSLASCLGGYVRLLEIATGRFLKEYSGHTNNSFKSESCFESDNCSIIAASEDGSVMHWEMTSGITTHSSPDMHRKAIGSVSYHPNQPLFLTASHDGEAKLWEVRKVTERLLDD